MHASRFDRVQDADSEQKVDQILFAELFVDGLNDREKGGLE